MPKTRKTSRPAEPPPPPQQARRTAMRRATAERKLRILERLTAGVSVAHIARVENITIRRVRQIIAEMLAKREVDPPAGFVQLQIARLSDAMIVAHTMMMEGDLQAMDRLIRLAGELDRYHGFGRAEIAAAPEAAPPPQIAAPARELLLPKPAPEEDREAEIFLPATRLKEIKTRQETRAPSRLAGEGATDEVGPDEGSCRKARLPPQLRTAVICTAQTSELPLSPRRRRAMRRDPSSVTLRVTPSPARGKGRAADFFSS